MSEAYIESLLRKARHHYSAWGVIPLDVLTALDRAGLVLEDVIRSYDQDDNEETNNGE
jgi:hypothetical protein